jgi:hypothetical protein
MIKQLILLVVLLSLVCVPFVSATTFTLSNSSVSTTENESYPETLFYTIFLIGAVMIVFDIRFITSKSIPGTPMIITSTIGFCMFLICAYMAPMVAKQVWVVSGTDAQFISTYIFSPWVTYLMLGLSMICFSMIWYGLLRLYQIFVENEKRLRDPDHQFEMYMKS